MDGGGQGGAEPQPPQEAQIPQNETPLILATGFDTIILVIQTYGWFLMMGVFAIMYLYQKYKPSYEKWKQEQENKREDELRKKDPDRSYAIQLSMEQARHKLQERVSADAEIKRNREKEIAEQKRLQKIQEWENHKQGKGYHSKQKGTREEESLPPADNQLKSKRKKDFRPAYNPLSGGDGGGGPSRYRPSGRGFGGGGGGG